MSNEITTAMVDTYQEGIELLAQQMASVLEPYVRTDSKTGERVSFDQVGVVAARERLVRHGDTQYVNTPHRRRWVSHRDFEIADLLDVQDIINILNDPGGEYAEAFVAALNREMDAEVIDKMLGTNYTGKTGVTATALPAGQKIAAGGTGFTLAKVQSAMQIFKAANAVDRNMRDVELHIAWTSAQESPFLNTTEVKSIDYNTQKVLVDGGMGDGKFYGFNYHRLEDWTDENAVAHLILPKVSTTRSCVAWIKRGVMLNKPDGPRTLVDRMPSKSQATQIWTGGSFGATRLQDTHVVQIDVVES